MIVVAIIGVLAVLATFGIQKYLASAKTAEATNTLGRINDDAVIAYGEERVPPSIGTGPAGGTSHHLCPSTLGAIPATPPKGLKYTANPTADYIADPGFLCLGFTMNQPQYFAYDYVSGGPSKIAPGAVVTNLTGWGTGAAADFDGDGVNFVEFATGGNIVNGIAITSTSIASWNVKTGTPF
jgi:type IV pilus assembly protein PilA